MPKQHHIKKLPMSEQDLLSQVRSYFRIKKYMWWRNAQGQFSQPGIPDLMVLKDGVLYAIELKAPSGKGIKSNNQIAFIDNVNRNGGVGIFATMLEEIIEVLEGK